MIDYTWRQADTEADFQRVIRHDALAFLTWRAKHPARKQQPLTKAFRVWWLLKGRIGFRTSEDGIRFRNEVMVYAASLKDELSAGAA